MHRRGRRDSVLAMSGDRLGLLSLRWDAVYCVVVGVTLVALAPWISPRVDLAAALVVSLGVAVVVWAALVAWMAQRFPRRRAVTITMCANVIAALAVAALAPAVSGLIVTLVVIAIAVDVGAFATSQAVALRRIARGTTGDGEIGGSTGSWM